VAIHPISIDQLNLLSVDDETGRIFWNGQEIVTTLSLPWYVNLAIIIGAAAAVITALWPIFKFYWHRS
jgi:hypothetical protein